MNVTKLKFKGFYLIKPKIHRDKRGVFRRHFCQKVLKKNGINFKMCQGNVSESYKKGTLRGFHYKEKPSREYKILSCLKGKLFHVAVDLRENSKTYGKHFSRIMDSKKYESLIIPPNCANAFLTLENDTIVHYYMGDFFQKNKYKGFRFNDPFFKFKWPFEPKIINTRDKSYKDFKI